MTFRNDPEGRRLPVKLDTTSNGEYAPLPLEPVHREANHLAMEAAAANAKHLGLERRNFLVSACGAATTLLSMNTAYAKAGRTGGHYDLPALAALEEEAAQVALAGDEFIFDVQGHFVNPTGAWLERMPPDARPMAGFTADARCKPHEGSGRFEYLRCIGPDQFVKDVFMDSDTDLMVLSFVPSTFDDEPLKIEEAEATAQIVEKLDGTHRLYLHGRVNPNQQGDLERMEVLAQRHKVSAFKTYTQWGPQGNGFWLDDDVGIAMIERARQLGVRNIAVHKGLAFGPKSYEHSTCADVGRIAKRFPDMNFLIYHSGFVPGANEGPYAQNRTDGVDSLVTSLLENGIAPGSNVYAELGSTWRLCMRNPDTAAHTLGKLIKYCGESNVLWGTDSVWYGSPQDQIQAFRTFQISASLRERYGYAAMTPQLRAKIFGLNALKIYPVPPDVLKRHLRNDRVAVERLAYSEQPDPSFVTYGPKTRREFLNLRTWDSGHHDG